MPKNSKYKQCGNTLLCICSFFLAIFSLCALSGCSLPRNADNPTQDESSDNTTETAEFSIGETFSGDGLNITLQNVEDWNSDNEFKTPKDGYKFIRAYFIIKNTDTTAKYLGPYDFDCYADNSKMEMARFRDNAMRSTEISGGRELQGYIYYEIPVNSQSIEIEYCFNRRNSEKAIFKVK